MRSLKNKAQAAYEFIYAYSLVGLFFFLILTLTYNYISDYSVRNRYLILKQMGEKISDELRMASYMYEGYERDFNIPKSYFGINITLNFYNASYLGKGTIETNHSELIIFDNYSNNNVIFFLPKNIYGNLSKGENHIIKRNNKVYIFQ